jgi:hypothetical protein
MRTLRFLALLSLLVAGACSDDTGGQEGGNGFQLGDDLNLSIQPESVNFGAVPLDEERFVEVTLRHTGGSGILRLLDVQFLTESPDLSIGAPGSSELEPGTSTTIQVRYQPSDGAHDDGTIIIETNVPRTEGGTLTYEIPVLTLQQTAEVISEPFLHDFGSVESATSAEHTFTLRFAR